MSKSCNLFFGVLIHAFSLLLSGRRPAIVHIMKTCRTILSKTWEHAYITF